MLKINELGAELCTLAKIPYSKENYKNQINDNLWTILRSVYSITVCIDHLRIAGYCLNVAVAICYPTQRPFQSIKK